MEGLKDLDLVVFGATGFTGRRAAEHLVRHAPADLRWAIAGRHRASLERLGIDVPILVGDEVMVSGPSVAAVVSRARVVLNMAGPFRRLSDPIVAACIEHGAHYCDISGETGRIRDLIDREQESAHRAGVKIVCFGGVSSAPADLAVLLLQEQLGEIPREITATVRLRSGLFTGGTVSSMSDAVTTGDAGAGTGSVPARAY